MIGICIKELTKNYVSSSSSLQVNDQAVTYAQMQVNVAVNQEADPFHLVDEHTLPVVMIARRNHTLPLLLRVLDRLEFDHDGYAQNWIIEASGAASNQVEFADESLNAGALVGDYLEVASQ